MKKLLHVYYMILNKLIFHREIQKSSSLRATINMRPSRRNLERELIEDGGYSEPQAQVPKVSPSSSQNSKMNLSPVKELSDTIGPWQTRSEGGILDIEDGTRITGIPSLSDIEALEKWERDSGYAGKNKKAECGSIKGAVMRKNSNEKFSHGSQDDSVVHRRWRGENITHNQRQSRTLSFRSELAKRIAVQSEAISRSSGNLAELQEVEMLYENLLEDDISCQATGRDSVREQKAETSSDTSKSQTDNKQNPKHNENQNQQGLVNSVSFSNSTITPSSSNTSCLSSPSQDHHHDSPERINVSSAGVGTKSKDQSMLSRTITHSGANGNNTVRRPTNNAVIVLSGGDGYRDLDMSRNQAKSDDASIIFWLYKY